MSTSVEIIVGILAIVGYLLAPVVLVWGWVRWIQQPKLRTISAVLSLLGFILASASACWLYRGQVSHKFIDSGSTTLRL